VAVVVVPWWVVESQFGRQSATPVVSILTHASISPSPARPLTVPEGVLLGRGQAWLAVAPSLPIGDAPQPALHVHDERAGQRALHAALQLPHHII